MKVTVQCGGYLVRGVPPAAKCALHRGRVPCSDGSETALQVPLFSSAVVYIGQGRSFRVAANIRALVSLLLVAASTQVINGTAW